MDQLKVSMSFLLNGASPGPVSLTQCKTADEQEVDVSPNEIRESVHAALRLCRTCRGSRGSGQEPA